MISIIIFTFSMSLSEIISKIPEQNMMIVEVRYGNGQTYILEHSQNGKLEGERKVWHYNGQLKTHEFFRNGKREGERKCWAENGQLIIVEFRREGKLDRGCKEWHNDGKISVKEFRRNGNIEGEYKFWNEDGVRKVYTFHRNNKCIDPIFTISKKNIFLKIKKRFRNDIIHNTSTDQFLISDLSRTL